MPFKGARQRRYMFAKEPEIARRWAKESKSRAQEPKKRVKRRSRR